MNTIIEEIKPETPCIASEMSKTETDVDLVKKYVGLYQKTFKTEPEASEEDVEASEEDVEASEEKTRPSKSRKTTKTVKPSHKVVLSSGLDAVIEKRTSLKNIQLILMPSQNQYLIKKGNIISKLETMEEEELIRFFNPMRMEDAIEINNSIFKAIGKSDVKNLLFMIKDYSDLLKEGMMSLPLFLKMVPRYVRDTYSLSANYFELLENKKLLKYLCVHTPILEGTSKYDEVFIGNVLLFVELLGYDQARNFADNYTKSSISGFTSGFYLNTEESRNCFKEILSEKYNLNTKALMDYLFFDLYRQGFRKVPIKTYCDYLRMSHAYDPKKYDKYPKALLTAHDIIAKKVNESQIISAILNEEIAQKQIENKSSEAERKIFVYKEGFRKTYEEFEKDYPSIDDVVFESKDILLKKPSGAKEIIDEGMKLNHCVSSYIEPVSKGETIILFAREKKNPEIPYLTVEVRKRKVVEGGNVTTVYNIAQIQGAAKRVILTKKEEIFFSEVMETLGMSSGNRRLINFN